MTYAMTHGEISSSSPSTSPQPQDPDSTRFGQIWQNSAESGQVMPNLAKFGQIRLNFKLKAHIPASRPKSQPQSLNLSIWAEKVMQKPTANAE